MLRRTYARFADKELTLNDYLAIDRTVLANERTLLAYGRTALALLVIGGSVIKFFVSPLLWLGGAVFIAGAAFTMAWGWRRYRQTNALLSAALEHETGLSEHPLKEETAKAREQDKEKEAGTGSGPQDSGETPEYD